MAPTRRIAVAFEIHKGTNISHWLSQSDACGEERRQRFTREDALRLSDLGLDHLRLPVDDWDFRGGFGLFDRQNNPTAALVALFGG
jgi:hypothetical protein